MANKKIDYKLLIKNTIEGFIEHKAFKMSASLAYITIFSIGPFLLVLLYLSDIFWGRQAVEGTIYYQIKTFIGPNGADQIQNIIKNLSVSNASSFAGIVGIATLLIGATSVFAEIQDSINTIWGIKPINKSGIWLYIKARILSFGVIGSFGFILLVSLGLSSLIDVLSDTLTKQFSESALAIIYIVNIGVTFIITSLLFGAIFTILPDAEIKWKQIKVAAFTTTTLFMVGKMGISFYINNSNITSVYGTAGSFVVLMVWVYYSSMLLYLGAEFAKCYAIQKETPINPSKFAEFSHQIEIASDAKNLKKANEESINLKKQNHSI